VSEIDGSLKTELFDSSDVEYKLKMYGVNSVAHISSCDSRVGGVGELDWYIRSKIFG